MTLLYLEAGVVVLSPLNCPIPLAGAAMIALFPEATPPVVVPKPSVETVLLEVLYILLAAATGKMNAVPTLRRDPTIIMLSISCLPIFTVEASFFLKVQNPQSYPKVPLAIAADYSIVTPDKSAVAKLEETRKETP